MASTKAGITNGLFFLPDPVVIAKGKIYRVLPSTTQDDRHTTYAMLIDKGNNLLIPLAFGLTCLSFEGVKNKINEVGGCAATP